MRSFETMSDFMDGTLAQIKREPLSNRRNRRTNQFLVFIDLPKLRTRYVETKQTLDEVPVLIQE